MRIVLIGPGDEPEGGLPDDVVGDLARLSRPGVEVAYRFSGGPTHVHDALDASAAAPFIVAAARQAEHEGADAVVIDCTDDPGLDEARAMLRIDVVGSGEALRSAIDAAPSPVVVWTGDALRSTSFEDLRASLPEGATVALGGSGWSHLADRLRSAGHAVLDPLDVAVGRCARGR